jgi:hypothetical protein
MVIIVHFQSRAQAEFSLMNIASVLDAKAISEGGHWESQRGASECAREGLLQFPSIAGTGPSSQPGRPAPSQSCHTTSWKSHS